jgi:transposase-like protein
VRVLIREDAFLIRVGIRAVLEPAGVAVVGERVTPEQRPSRDIVGIKVVIMMSASLGDTAAADLRLDGRSRRHCRARRAPCRPWGLTCLARSVPLGQGPQVELGSDLIGVDVSGKRSFSLEFREAAVREVIEKSRTIAEVARENGVVARTLGNWVAAWRAEHPESAENEPPLTQPPIWRSDARVSTGPTSGADTDVLRPDRMSSIGAGRAPCIVSRR